MNVRIFWVRTMKCMCAQTRPRFILSSERVFGGMEFEPMLTPREKSPLPENVPRGGSNPRRCGQRAQALPTELFRPRMVVLECSFPTSVEYLCSFWLHQLLLFVIGTYLAHYWYSSSLCLYIYLFSFWVCKCVCVYLCRLVFWDR